MGLAQTSVVIAQRTGFLLVLLLLPCPSFSSKDFFLSLKEVHLKPKALDYSLAPLRKILSIYQQTTSSLIGQFVQQETEQGEEGEHPTPSASGGTCTYQAS